MVNFILNHACVFALSLVAPETLASAITSSVSEGSFIKISQNRKTPLEKNKQWPNDESDDTSKLFACPVEGCVKMFQRYTSLDNHLQYGRCTLKQEKESLVDRAKMQYQEKLLESQAPQPFLQPAKATSLANSHTSLTRGWALKTTKKTTRVFQTNKGLTWTKSFSLEQRLGTNKTLTPLPKKCGTPRIWTAAAVLYMKNLCPQLKSSLIFHERLRS
jgi:hypothetical protein